LAQCGHRVRVTAAGYGHGTASTLSWNGTRLRAWKRPLAGERDGDGTVPAFSAIPPEWSGGAATTSVRPTGDTHGAIGHTGRLREYLELLNSGDPPPTRGSGDGEARFLGFDVADLVEPGEQLVGSLRVDTSRIPPLDRQDRPAVRAELRDLDGRSSSLEVELAAHDRFVVDLPEDVQGVVHLAAKLTGEGGARLRATEQVVVLGAGR
jgi:hypothetical protein